MKAKVLGWLGVFGMVTLLTVPAPSFSQALSDSSHVLMRADTLQLKLGLTDEQTAKIRDIIKANYEQTLKDRELYKGARMAMMRASKERNEKMKKDIFTLLTNEQKKKYEALKKERMATNPRRTSAQREKATTPDTTTAKPKE